jgi:cytochrome c551/c552
MSKSDRLIGALAVALLLVTALPAQARENYKLGRKATAAEIAGWNIDVRPDGKGLPEGQGSVSQGGTVYDADCASCHGSFGESNEYLALTGIKAKLNHATTLFDYINRAMPFPHPKSLTADQVYAVAAYVLNLNDIVPSDFVANKQTLPKVKMPNAGALKPYPGMMSVHGKPDVHNTACMKNCEKVVKISGSLPAGFTKSLYGDIRDNFRGLETMNEQAPPKADLPGGTMAGKTSAAGEMPKMITASGCTACHALDHKILGPSFRDVAKKYQGNPGATKHLIHKIRNGGAGVWGSIPMPPHPDLSDADLSTMVQWILTQKAAK